MIKELEELKDFVENEMRECQSTHSFDEYFTLSQIKDKIDSMILDPRDDE